MTYEDYADLAAEMNILFRYIDDELVEKVPQKIIEFFQDIASPTFRSKIDPRFPLDEQDLLPSTECMLTLLYRQYWCSEEERAELDQLLVEQAALQEEQNKATFDNLFDKIDSPSENLFVEDTNGVKGKNGFNLPAVVNKDFIMEKIQQFKEFILKIINDIFKKNKEQ